VHSICQCAPTCIQCLDEALHVYINILYMCVCALYRSILALLSFCKRAMTKTSGGNFVCVRACVCVCVCVCVCACVHVCVRASWAHGVFREGLQSKKNGYSDMHRWFFATPSSILLVCLAPPLACHSTSTKFHHALRFLPFSTLFCLRQERKIIGNGRSAGRLPRD